MNTIHIRKELDKIETKVHEMRSVVDNGPEDEIEDKMIQLFTLVDELQCFIEDESEEGGEDEDEG